MATCARAPNVIELRCCDVCQRLTPRRKLQPLCDMLLCPLCYRRYGSLR